MYANLFGKIAGIATLTYLVSGVTSLLLINSWSINWTVFFTVFITIVFLKK